ncbi:unnamed protein product [Rotaria sordida]|nr:unnamed protein product [Rotaria sordida]
MPTPLFDGRDGFLRVNAIFNELDDINQIRALINECAQNQSLMYSIYMWFLQRYCQFHSPKVQADENLLKLVRTDWKQSLLTICEPIGYELIVSLWTISLLRHTFTFCRPCQKMNCIVVYSP